MCVCPAEKGGVLKKPAQAASPEVVSICLHHPWWWFAASRAKFTVDTVSSGSMHSLGGLSSIELLNLAFFL